MFAGDGLSRGNIPKIKSLESRKKRVCFVVHYKRLFESLESFCDLWTSVCEIVNQHLKALELFSPSRKTLPIGKLRKAFCGLFDGVFDPKDGNRRNIACRLRCLEGFDERKKCVDRCLARLFVGASREGKSRCNPWKELMMFDRRRNQMQRTGF